VFIRGYFLHFFFVSWWFCGYESIMQNKPNLLDTQMNVTSVKTKEYENKRLFRRPENKPNQTQLQTNHPIFQNFPQKPLFLNFFLFFTFLFPYLFGIWGFLY